MGTIVLDEVEELITIKISELPSLESANNDSVLPIVDSENTYKITEEDLNKININERTTLVSSTFIDDVSNHKFSTIQAAIDYIHNSSWYGDLNNEQNAVVAIYPGTYNEQLTSYPYIKVINVFDKSNQGDSKTVQISPPSDKKTETILIEGSGYVYNFIGITFTADPVEHGPYANAINAKFYNCRFNNGSFLDGDADYACTLIFTGCTLNGPTPINFTGTRGHADRSIYFYDTYGYADIILESTFPTGNPHVEALNSYLSASMSIKDDWGANIIDCRIQNFTGSPNRIIFDTTGDIKLDNSTMSGGIHFISNPGHLCIQRCSFNEPNATAIIGADITADVPITNVEYCHNVQQNGIAGEIQTNDPVKHIGNGSINEYYSLQDAINSIAVKGVIDLRGSVVGLNKIVIPSNVNVTIDGHKLHSLTFTNDIVELGANEQLVFYGLANLTGGNIEVNGDSSYVGFEECLTVDAYITLTSGVSSYCLIYTSSLDAPSGYPAIKIDNTDTVIVSGYSRVKGGVGHPALMFTVDADSKLKSKYSTILHGDGSTNTPLGNTSGVDINISMYACGLNAAWNPSQFTNTIGSAGNITDPQIDF